MSLDVYLSMKGCLSISLEGRIFIREDGQNREISRTEWDERFPDREPVILPAEIDGSGNVYHANITHNLGRMASETGIYECLWRPDEIGIMKASELIECLRAGLQALRNDPERFKRFNPANGWGTYEGLVQFVENYLATCEQYPDATVSVWR